MNDGATLFDCRVMRSLRIKISFARLGRRVCVGVGPPHQGEMGACVPPSVFSPRVLSVEGVAHASPKINKQQHHETLCESFQTGTPTPSCVRCCVRCVNYFSSKHTKQKQNSRTSKKQTPFLLTMSGGTDSVGDGGDGGQDLSGRFDPGQVREGGAGEAGGTHRCAMRTLCCTVSTRSHPPSRHPGVRAASITHSDTHTHTTHSTGRRRGRQRPPRAARHAHDTRARLRHAHRQRAPRARRWRTG